MPTPKTLLALERRLSIAAKVGVPVILVSILSSVLFGAISLSEATQRERDSYAFEGRDIAQSVQKQAVAHPGVLPAMNKFLIGLSNAHPSVARIRVIKQDSRGALVWASSAPVDAGIPFQGQLPAPGASISFDATLAGTPLLVELDGLQAPGDIVTVASYFSLDPLNQAITALTRRIVLESLGVLLFQLATLGLVMYLTVIRRLKRLSKVASAVAGGDFTVRLPEGKQPPSADELSSVAREFDEMIRAVRMRTDLLEDAAERERADAEKLRELDRVKNTLLHAVSHDLRGPITSVLGSAATLERAGELGLSEEDRTALLGGLSAGARKMHALVSNLLDLDRLDRGIVTPKRKMTDLGALVDGVLDEIGPVADRTIHREIEHFEIAVDGPKVERIVENLLGNTLKHTEGGTEVWVGVKPFDGGALISVDDAGIGVPQELRNAIFQPFSQGPEGPGTGSGVGIGLSLVARFAELHGGRAWVSDRVGGGASFNVYVPDGDPEAVDQACDSSEGDI